MEGIAYLLRKLHQKQFLAFYGAWGWVEGEGEELRAQSSVY